MYVFFKDDHLSVNTSIKTVNRCVLSKQAVAIFGNPKQILYEVHLVNNVICASSGSESAT